MEAQEKSGREVKWGGRRREKEKEINFSLKKRSRDGKKDDGYNRRRPNGLILGR